MHDFIFTIWLSGASLVFAHAQSHLALSCSCCHTSLGWPLLTAVMHCLRRFDSASLRSPAGFIPKAPWGAIGFLTLNRNAATCRPTRHRILSRPSYFLRSSTGWTGVHAFCKKNHRHHHHSEHLRHGSSDTHLQLPLQKLACFLCAPCDTWLQSRKLCHLQGMWSRYSRWSHSVQHLLSAGTLIAGRLQSTL